MKNYNLYMTTGQPDPMPEPEDDDSPTYEEVHDDGDSGYGNMKD
mgnify:CR=1 FL=1